MKRDEAQNVSCERIGGWGEQPPVAKLEEEAQLGLFGSKGVLCMATNQCLGQQHTTTELSSKTLFHLSYKISMQIMIYHIFVIT